MTGSVSKLTSVLVVGGWDPTLTETASRGLSAKAAKAMAVLEAGYEIHIWTEQDLIANL